MSVREEEMTVLHYNTVPVFFFARRRQLLRLRFTSYHTRYKMCVLHGCTEFPDDGFSPVAKITLPFVADRQLPATVTYAYITYVQ